MSKYEELQLRYREGFITDPQLDGTGAEESSHQNYVALKVITQAQADAIRQGAADPTIADMQAAIEVYEGGGQ
jgi:hypothetical protein